MCADGRRISSDGEEFKLDLLCPGIKILISGNKRHDHCSPRDMKEYIDCVRIMS